MEIPGDQLLQLCQNSKSNVMLVAPFVKEKVLNRLLSVISGDVAVTCITRWRPEEIKSGVSDLAVWDCLKERPGSGLYLKHNLHAKYWNFLYLRISRLQS